MKTDVRLDGGVAKISHFTTQLKCVTCVLDYRYTLSHISCWDCLSKNEEIHHAVQITSDRHSTFVISCVMSIHYHELDVINSPMLDNMADQ